MRRFTWSIVLLLGGSLPAYADPSPQVLAASTVNASAAPDAPDGTDTESMSAYLMRKFGVARQKAEKISDAVSLAAAKYSLPPGVLLAIISIESRFREKARGANGATGLMQVVPSVHRGLIRNVKDLTEPGANINVGSAILYGYMQAAGGDLDLAMRRYGGSQAYAQKIRVRAEEFNRALDIDAAPGADATDGDGDRRATMSRSRR
ncbi:MAG: hypothetical protein GAK40_01450 [Burkholderia plantarii]|nr:MAG: hypothetical protein GAK40_01450 [Burkholderia plantarii]